MSGYLAGKVWQSALPAHLKPLAAALADIANDDGTRIYPSVAYVAWLLGRSERAVQDGLAELKDAGVLKALAYLRGGRGHATHYQMIESALPEREPWRKGEAVAPFSKKGEVDDVKGAESNTKGEVSDERVQITTVKGEAGCTRTVKEPPLDPLIEPPKDTRDLPFFDEWRRVKGEPHWDDPREKPTTANVKRRAVVKRVQSSRGTGVAG